MKKTGLILAIGLSSFAAMAQASPDLVFNNNTENYITSRVNNFLCSSILIGGEGITKPWEQGHVIHSGTISMACGWHKTDCQADIYTSDDCSGEKIASAILNTNTGHADVTPTSSKYEIINSGFTFTLNKK